MSKEMWESLLAPNVTINIDKAIFSIKNSKSVILV